MFVLQGQGSRGLDVDLTDVCTELLFQAQDPGMQAVRQSSLRDERRRWLRRGGGGVGGIMTRASCLCSWGWRSVRQARNWPVGLTDGDFEWGAEKLGQPIWWWTVWMTHQFTESWDHHSHPCWWIMQNGHQLRWVVTRNTISMTLSCRRESDYFFPPALSLPLNRIPIWSSWSECNPVWSNWCESEHVL